MVNTKSSEWTTYFRVGFLVALLITIGIGIAMLAPTPTKAPPSFASIPQATSEPIATSEPMSTPDPILPHIVKVGAFATWNYTVTWLMDGHYDLTTAFDESSVTSIKAYANENRQLAATLQGSTDTVPVKVTFKRTLSQDEYRTWIRDTGFIPEQAVLRILGSDGMRAAGGVEMTEGDVFPDVNLDPSRYPEGSIVEGVYICLGTISANRLEDVVSEQHVFLADVSIAIVRQELEAETGDTEFTLDPNVGSPFWQMEDYGLDNFQQ